MSGINSRKDRVEVQTRTVTLGATGETVVWSPRETLYACVIPLDVSARAIYQQLHSEVTHKIRFHGSVDLSLSENRLIWGSKTLEITEPPRAHGNATTVLVKED